MVSSARRQLGAFLRERRRNLASSEGAVGLRREEVAARAFISTEYYTRIEQGRFIPSPEVLLAIGGVLELGQDERQYMLDLVHTEGRLPLRPPPVTASEGQLDPGLVDFVHALGPVPTLAVGARTELLAWNAAAEELFFDFSEVDSEERTCAHVMFTQEAFMSRFHDVEEMQRTVVATLRASLVATPLEKQEQLIADLSERSEAFARLWSEHQVRQPHDTTPTVLDHPLHGRQEVNRVVLRTVDAPGVRLLFFPPRWADRRLGVLGRV